MSEYLCNTCLSSNIKILKGDEAIDKNGDYKEMDLYCYSCKSEDYKISDWYIKQNKSFFKGIEYLYYNNQRRKNEKENSKKDYKKIIKN